MNLKFTKPVYQQSLDNNSSSLATKKRCAFMYTGNVVGAFGISLFTLSCQRLQLKDLELIKIWASGLLIECKQCLMQVALKEPQCVSNFHSTGENLINFEVRYIFICFVEGSFTPLACFQVSWLNHSTLADSKRQLRFFDVSLLIWC